LDRFSASLEIKDAVRAIRSMRNLSAVFAA
jgi:hypothetical protein